MHGYALAARHVAHNRFAANWIATARAIHQQIVVTFYLDCPRVWSLPKDAPDDRTDRCRFFRWLIGRRCLIRNFWRELGQHLPRRIFSVADPCQQILPATQ